MTRLLTILHQSRASTIDEQRRPCDEAPVRTTQKSTHAADFFRRADAPCVEHDLALIRRACQQQAQTPSDLMTKLNASPHATWHEDENIHYFYALSGYLDYLIGRGELHQESAGYVTN